MNSRLCWIVGLTLPLAVLAASIEAAAQCDPDTRCFVFDETGRQRLMRYSYYLPDGYDPSQQYPLVIWLHGAGHRGLNGEYLGAGQFSVLQEQTRTDFPAVFLAPQLASGVWTTTNPVDFTLQIAADLIDELPIDPNRV